MSGSRATFTQSVSQLAQEEAAATSSLFLAGIPLPSSPEQAFRIKQQQKKKKKKKILFSTCTPLDVKKSARQNISEMGAFRVLLGTLHYMGLYMQLSVSTRQAGHGEIENHISGNGRCELRFGLLFFHGKGGCGEGGTGDAICSYAEVELNKRASHGLEAGADDDAN